MNLTPNQYRYLTWQFDDGEGIHPDVATKKYGFPTIKRPGLEVFVPEPPMEIDVLEAHQVVIFQSHRYKNGNLVWLRRRSYSNWRRDDTGEAP